jgi:hypothetical protein
MAYPNLQSKPGAEYVLYLNFEGFNSNDLTDIEKKRLMLMINSINVDFFPINTSHNNPICKNLYPESSPQLLAYGPNHPLITTYNRKLDCLYIPGINDTNGYNKGNWTTNDFTNIWRWTSYKLETFNVNVTTDRTVWQSKVADPSKRYMSIFSWRPPLFSVYTPPNANPQIAFAGFEELGCPDKGISFYRFLAHVSYSPNGTTPVKRKDEFVNINFIFDSAYLCKPERFIYTQTVNGVNTSIAHNGSMPTPNIIFDDVEEVAHSTVHEFGHFAHDPFINHDGVVNGGDYYGGHNGWNPIMGNTANVETPPVYAGLDAIDSHQMNPISYSSNYYITQWSKGEYKNANEKQDDIQLLGKFFGWIKEPLDKTNKKQQPNLNNQDIIKIRHIVKGDLTEQTDPVHIFSNFNKKNINVKYPGFKKTIKGMIGSSYDSDILKILLKAGSYQFRLITPRDSSFYGGLSVERLEEFNIGKLETDENNIKSYPTDIPENRFEAVLCKNDQRIGGYPAVFGNFKNVSLNENYYRVTTCYANAACTVLIYLKIFGDKKPNPLDTETGFSEYGSIGKYFLELSQIRDSVAKIDNGDTNILNTNILPHTISEIYYSCSHGGYNIYFTEKTYNPGDGTEDSNGAHFLTVPIFKNDRVIEKKFLVYGQPLSFEDYDNLDEEGREGKNYLPVIIDGQPKMQEFIMG